MTRLVIAVALALAACNLSTPADKNECITQADCLEGFVCSAAGVCEHPMQCTPTTCAANQCDLIDDGCGGELNCGGCPSGQECGLLEANQCGILPPHCTNGHIDASLGETGPDCGGSCSGCPTGGGCNTTDDCATGNTCSDGVCLAGTWSTVAELPTPRERLAAVVGPDGLIYVMGGTGSGASTGVVEVFNPATNSWSARTPMPTPRYGFAAVVGNDGKIYTVGGQYFSVSDEFRSTTAEVYDPTNDTWQALPSLPEGRYTASAAVALDGAIYVTGGYRGTTGQTFATTVKLTPGATSWVAVTPAMTSPRSSHAMARATDGKLYAIAGYNGSNDLASFEYMTPGTPGWNTLPPLMYPRKQHAATVSGDKIYAIGGSAPSVALYITTIEAYSTTTNAWSRAPNLPAGRYGHAAVTLPDGRIFVIGGRRALTTTSGEQTPLVEVLTF
ncbi:MAG TPA: kelch repeat-containing protein [Kofleriaceae bacterium]